MAYFRPPNRGLWPDPLDRDDHRDTIIDTEPQVGLYERSSAGLKIIDTTEYRGDGMERRTSKTDKTSPSDTTSLRSSLWSRPQPQDSDDELYTLTDDESVEVPLICSDSVKKRAAKAIKGRYPSLVIPSPSHWPMPPSACKQSAYAIGLSPVSKIAPCPARVAAFNAHHRQRIPSRTSTPSLDGSLTSDELAASSDSCPSTPDRSTASPQPGEWEPPTQLNPDAIALLKALTPPSPDGSEAGEVQCTEEIMDEMRQIARDPPIRRQLVPGSDLSASALPPGSEPVSALTVPSPGGFFASLHASARQTWCVSSTPAPSTGTAERFYGVPWRSNSRSNSPQRDHGLRLDIQRAITPPPAPGAKPPDPVFSPVEGTDIEATEITTSAFQAAKQNGSEPESERTKRWLSAQSAYLATITAESPKTPEKKLTSCFSPDTPSSGHTGIRASPYDESPSKKSVRFLESVPESEEASFTHRSAEVEPLFFQGFRDISRRFHGTDAFSQSQARVEAAHVSSSSLPQSHVSQLSGSFSLASPDRPHLSRPISALVPSTIEEDEQSKVTRQVERERQALEQIVPSVWSLHAARHIFGSSLVYSPAVAHLRSGPDRRILDYGGAPTCDWGWTVALQFRHAAVITVAPPLSSPRTDIPSLSGPPNHSVTNSMSLTTLPFPNASFDLISARSLHTLLRTVRRPGSGGEDEYDLLLSEFLRVLKPGGYLEFNLLDGELLHPGPLGQALSVEFAFVLRQRGYDPQASRYFLPRLRKAGFAEVKRAWMVLPAADVVPRWVDRGKLRPQRHARADSGVGQVADEIVAGEEEWGHEAEGAVPGTRHYDVRDERGERFGRPVTGSTGHVRAMTGLMGARAWEQWILKVQRETGGSEEKMLGRVNRALEEAGKGKAGWRCLMGWARKAE